LFGGITNKNFFLVDDGSDGAIFFRMLRGYQLFEVSWKEIPVKFPFPLFPVTTAQPMQEAFLEELELVQEDLLANDLVIEGEFMTEECMKTEWKFSQYLGGQLKSMVYHWLLNDHGVSTTKAKD
jgi:hypothetical protein